MRSHSAKQLVFSRADQGLSRRAWVGAVLADHSSCCADDGTQVRSRMRTALCQARTLSHSRFGRAPSVLRNGPIFGQRTTCVAERAFAILALAAAAADGPRKGLSPP